MASSVQEVYERHVKPLSAEERLRLLALVAQDLVHTAAAPPERPKRSIMELHGLGKEIWEGVDPQQYVDEMRNEWDHRP